MEQFNKCALYIDANRSKYDTSKITSVTIDGARVSQCEIEQLENYRFVILHNLTCLKDWQKTASEHLQALLDHRFMQPGASRSEADFFSRMEMGKMNQTQLTISAYKNRDSNYYKVNPKNCCIYQTYNHYKNLFNWFSNEVSDYLSKDLLPYWGEVAKWFISYALITSVVQGKIDFYQAKQEYETISKTIEFIYGGHIDTCEGCFHTELNKMNNVEVVKKLEDSILKPIKDSCSIIRRLIERIEYSDYSGLKEKVSGSFEMFYNIAYGFGIINITSMLGRRPPIYTSIKYPSRSRNPFMILVEDIQLIRPIVYFANFIGGNAISLIGVNQKIRNLD